MNNRIIKFRAWDKKRIMMVQDCDLARLNQTWETEEYEFGDDCGKRITIDDDLEVMQFTGLTDKNGKEIYEGDIGKVVFDKIIPQYAICVAEWSDEYANISWTQKKLVNHSNPSRGWAIHVKGFEVIGNIYENPELLTD